MYSTHGEDYIDPREPFHDLDECDTCDGAPDSHVCRCCHTSMWGYTCESNAGLCDKCYRRGESGC